MFTKKEMCGDHVEAHSLDGSGVIEEEFSLIELGFKIPKKFNWGKISISEKSSVIKCLEYRINNHINTDFTVICGENVEFNCHLILLQCYSEYFSTMIPNELITLPPSDVTPSAFEIIYKWMKSDRSNCYNLLKRNNILEVYVAAQFLRISELAIQCKEVIGRSDLFSEDTAVVLFLMAKRMCLADIQSQMIPRIGSFFLSFVSTANFLEMDYSNICELLKSDNITVHNEYEVFFSAIRWLRHHWPNRQEFVLGVMYCVRFGLMSALQLVELRRSSPTEIADILTSDPMVLKIMDDGLAYSISNETNDNGAECLALEGIAPPTQRTWVDPAKFQSYLSYQDFLRDLNHHRKQLMEKVRCPTPAYNKEHTFDVKRKKSPDLSSNVALNMFRKYEVMLVKEEINSIDLKDLDGSTFEKEQTDCCSSQSESSFDEQKDRDEKEYDKSAPLLNQKISQQSLDENIHYKHGFKDKSQVLEKYNLEKMFVESKMGSAQKGSVPMISPTQESVLVFGGMNSFKKLGDTYNNAINIYRYHFTENYWSLIGELPKPRYKHAVTLHRERVYVAGGCDPSKKNQHGHSAVVSTVWSLDIYSRSWCREGNLTTARKNFGLVVFKGKIWAIGGIDGNGRALDSVEVYDSRSRLWRKGPSLATARYALAATVYEDSIWVAGGTFKTELASVERLFLNEDKWIPETVLRYPRTCAAFVTVQDNLYLVGGRTTMNGAVTSVKDVDVWTKNEWKHYFSLNSGRHYHAAAATACGQIMVMGGINQAKHCCLDEVEGYSCTRNIRLLNILKLPIPLAGLAAISLPRA